MTSALARQAGVLKVRGMGTRDCDTMSRFDSPT